MNNLLEPFFQQARLTPSALAATDSSSEISYGALLDNALRFYSQLSHYSFNTRHVAVYLPNGTEALSAIVSLLTAGLAYAALDPETPSDRNKQIADTGDFDYLITSELFVERAASFFSPDKILVYSDLIKNDPVAFELVQDVQPEDHSVLFFTSGSTGIPKCAVHTHLSIFNGLKDSLEILKVRKNDSFDMIAPLSFAASINVFLALQRGCPIHFFDVKRQGIHGYVKFLRERKISITVMTATVFRAVCRIVQTAGSGRFSSVRLVLMALKYARKYKSGNTQVKKSKIKAISEIVKVAGISNLPLLRMVNLVGEPVVPADIELFKSITGKNAELLNVYGASETRTISIKNFKHSDTDVKKVSAGYPFGQNEVFIVDQDLQLLDKTEEGQIMVSSPYLASGYYNNPKASSDSFIIHPAIGKRCYLTGDLGYISDQGELYQLGRIDSMVKVRGNRVDIFDIENCLLNCPGVSEAVVVNKGNSFSEALLVAYVVVNKEITHGMLREYVKSKVPDYMVPVFFVIKDCLPQTNTGKIDRKQLAEEALNFNNIVESPQDASLESDPIYLKVKDIIMDELHLPRLSPQNCFFNDLGGDSILATTVISRIKDEMNIELPYFILYRYRTIDKLVAYIKLQGNKTVTLDVLRKPERFDSPVIVFVAPVKGGAETYKFGLNSFPEHYGLFSLSYNITDEKTEKFLSLRYLAEQAAEALGQISNQRIVLMGYSMGGLLAYEIATHLDPGKVQKIIMLDIPPAKYKRLNILGIMRNDLLLFVKNTRSKNSEARRVNTWHMLMCLYYLFSFSHKVKHFEKRKSTLMAEAAHLRFFRQMNHRKFYGDMLLFRTNDPIFSKSRYNWEKFVKGKIETVHIQSSHFQLLHNDNIEILSSEIVKAIEKA
jgi:acyl-coenzyme A synthetase/AMP-(fatty) acid ligase/thioesterase domain-containing protein/acyl carrier protein